MKKITLFLFFALILFFAKAANVKGPEDDDADGELPPAQPQVESTGNDKN